MMEITAEIRALIDKAAAGVELAGDEYIDPADGLIHCKSSAGRPRACKTAICTTTPLPMTTAKIP